MLGSTVCTAQEWRSQLCRGDVVDSDNRSQLPGFSRAVIYNGGRIQCAWAYRIASKYTGGGGGYGMPPLWIRRGSRCGPSGMNQGTRVDTGESGNPV